MPQPAEVKPLFSMEELARLFIEKALLKLTSGQEFKLLLPVPALAKVLDINERMARELIRRGVVPSLKIGKKYLCPVVPLLQFLEQQASLPHHEQVASEIYLKKQPGKGRKRK